MEIINESVKDRVIQALEDPRWNWRTVDGISDSTGLPAQVVQDTLLSLNGQLLRSSFPDERGRALYTTVHHYKTHRSFFDRLRNAIAHRVA